MLRGITGHRGHVGWILIPLPPPPGVSATRLILFGSAVPSRLDCFHLHSKVQSLAVSCLFLSSSPYSYSLIVSPYFHICASSSVFPCARQLEVLVFSLCAWRVLPSRLRHTVHAVKRAASSPASTCAAQSSRAEEGRRMKVLCVAEKPSIAKSITEILSGGHWQTVSRGAALT